MPIRISKYQNRRIQAEIERSKQECEEDDALILKKFTRHIMRYEISSQQLLDILDDGSLNHPHPLAKEILAFADKLYVKRLQEKCQDGTQGRQLRTAEHALRCAHCKKRINTGSKYWSNYGTTYHQKCSFSVKSIATGGLPTLGKGSR